MAETFKAEEIRIGFHPAGYRIDKTASPMDFYTKWQITPEGEWINPKPTCFHSMPPEGWYKEPPVDSVKLKRTKDSLQALENKKNKKDSSKVKPVKTKSR